MGKSREEGPVSVCVSAESVGSVLPGIAGAVGTVPHVGKISVIDGGEGRVFVSAKRVTRESLAVALMKGGFSVVDGEGNKGE